MHRSHWDLEVYARDFQERRLTEAARSRLASEAVSAARHPSIGNSFNLAIARLVNAWKLKGVSRRAAEARHPEVGHAPVVTANVVPQAAGPTRSRLPQPYADMVVVARGPLVSVTEQPCGVRDC